MTLHALHGGGHGLRAGRHITASPDALVPLPAVTDPPKAAEDSCEVHPAPCGMLLCPSGVSTRTCLAERGPGCGHALGGGRLRRVGFRTAAAACCCQRPGAQLQKRSVLRGQHQQSQSAGRPPGFLSRCSGGGPSPAAAPNDQSWDASHACRSAAHGIPPSHVNRAWPRARPRCKHRQRARHNRRCGVLSAGGCCGLSSAPLRSRDRAAAAPCQLAAAAAAGVSAVLCVQYSTAWDAPGR